MRGGDHSLTKINKFSSFLDFDSNIMKSNYSSKYYFKTHNNILYGICNKYIFVGKNIIKSAFNRSKGTSKLHIKNKFKLHIIKN